MVNVVKYNDKYIFNAYALIKQKSKDDEIRAAEDLYVKPQVENRDTYISAIECYKILPVKISASVYNFCVDL